MLRPFAVLLTSALTLISGIAEASDKAIPGPSQGPAQPNPLAAPTPSPARLDFPAAHEAESKLMTVKITSPGTGELSATLSSPDFHIKEMRVVNPPAPNARSGAALNLPLKKDAAPFDLHVVPGSEVQIDVVFAPKVTGTQLRSATLSLAGPGAVVAWTQKVPLDGGFIGGVGIMTVGEIKVIQPTEDFELPVNLTGTDHDVTAHFHLVDPQQHIQVSETPFVVKKEIAQPVKAKLHLVNAWLGGGAYYPIGWLKLAIVYEGLSHETQTNVKLYVRSKQVETKQADHPTCDLEKVAGFVIVHGDGHIDLQFNWDAQSYSSDNSTAELFRAFYAGKVLAEGIYPKTQDSAVYFKSGVGPHYRVFYDPSVYTTMWDDPSKFSFSCKEVAGNAHF